MKHHQKLKELIAALKALGAKAEWTAEDETERERINGEITETRAAIEREKGRAAVGDEVAELEAYLNDPVTGIAHPKSAPAPTGKAGEGTGRVDVISRVRKGSLKAFKGEKAAENAYGFGQFLLAAFGGSEKAFDYCKQNGIEFKKHTEGGNNANGGILVPVQYDNEIIDLREEYGVARRLTKVKQMASDTMQVKKREGGLEAYPVGEGQVIRESNKAWGDVGLTARKWAVIARLTNELNEDSIINLADDFAQEIAEAFAKKEDDALFNGDGTSTYHKIQGIRYKLKSLHGTIANIAGLQVASGNAWSEITLADHTALLAKAPTYVFANSPRWFCSSAYYYNVMDRLADAANGNSRVDVIDGQPVLRFKGYPVEFVETMPAAEENSQVACLFGALSKAVMFGDRSQMTLARSDTAVVAGESMFEQDEQAIRATERFDINFHSPGNAHATASNRKAGPILGLITAAG